MNFSKINITGGEGVVAADFLTNGPTNWRINFCFVLIENN